MSDDAKNGAGLTDGWVMPEPVFRSSDGKVIGRQNAGDEAVTKIPPMTSASAAEIANEPNVADAPALNRVKAKPIAAKNSGGCLQVVFSIAGIISLLILILIVTAVYFIFYYRPAPVGIF
jgi:hypothetical protein